MIELRILFNAKHMLHGQATKWKLTYIVNGGKKEDKKKLSFTN